MPAADLRIQRGTTHASARSERSNKANGILLSTKGDGFDPLEMGNAEMWSRRLRLRRHREFYFYCDQSDVSVARPAQGPRFRINFRVKRRFIGLFSRSCAPAPRNSREHGYHHASARRGADAVKRRLRE